MTAADVTSDPWTNGEAEEGPLPRRTPGATIPYVPIPYVPRPSSQAGLAALRFSHPAPTNPVRVFGFNVVTIDPEGNHGGPRLDGVVSRQRALDEIDELASFMTDGYSTVMVEMREVRS